MLVPMEHQNIKTLLPGADTGVYNLYKVERPGPLGGPEPQGQLEKKKKRRKKNRKKGEKEEKSRNKAVYTALVAPSRPKKKQVTD